MDVDTAYKMLNQKFERIKKALERGGVDYDDECVTNLDGLLWGLAQDIAEGKFNASCAFAPRP